MTREWGTDHYHHYLLLTPGLSQWHRVGFAATSELWSSGYTDGWLGSCSDSVTTLCNHSVLLFVSGCKCQSPRHLKEIDSRDTVFNLINQVFGVLANHQSGLRTTLNYVSKRLLGALALIVVNSTYIGQQVRVKATPLVSVHVQVSRGRAPVR